MAPIWEKPLQTLRGGNGADSWHYVEKIYGVITLPAVELSQSINNVHIVPFIWLNICFHTIGEW